MKCSIQLKRLPAYYLLNFIIPMIVLALLSTVVFYVPVDSGEKLSISITILLSFSVFLLILSDSTPQVSQDLPFWGKKDQFFIHIGWVPESDKSFQCDFHWKMSRWNSKALQVYYLHVTIHANLFWWFIYFRAPKYFTININKVAKFKQTLCTFNDVADDSLVG